MKNPRRRTFYDWALEVLTSLSLLWALVPLVYYGDLNPEKKIPIHYNTLGAIDGWGDRSFLLFLPIGAFLFFVGLSLLDKYYTKFNYPIQVTEANAEGLYRLGVRLIRHIKFFIVLLFAYLGNATLALAMNDGTALNQTDIYVAIVGLLLSVIVYYVKMLRLKRRCC